MMMTTPCYSLEIEDLPSETTPCYSLEIEDLPSETTPCNLLLFCTRSKDRANRVDSLHLCYLLW